MEDTKNGTAPVTISPVAVAFLELGRDMVRAGRTGFRPGAPADCTVDPSAAISVLKAKADAPGIVTFNAGEPDPTEVRVLAVVSYLALMTDSHAQVRLVSELVGQEQPREVMLSRTAMRRLCERGALRFRNGQEKPWNGFVVLTPKSVSCLGLSLPYSPVFSEKTLGKTPAAQDDAEAAPAGNDTRGWIPTADAVATWIVEKVKGAYLREPIRTISAMYVTHLHRSAMIRQGKHPGTPNIVGLLIGSSSVGKTFLAETAARCVNEGCGEGTVPFSSFSATDLTSEGYVGCSVEDVVRPLLEQTGWDAAKARYGCALVDEVDKKACRTSRSALDVGGRGVQEGLLRILGGSVFPVGSRRVSWDSKSAQFNSDGTMFMLAGAFVGLQEAMGKGRGSAGIGFGDGADPKGHRRLRDALVDYGIIPELVSRIGSVILIQDPCLTDLVEICRAPGGMLSSYRRLWGSMGISVSVTEGAVAAMAGYGMETQFARSVQAVLNRVTERLVADGKKGRIRLGEREVGDVVSGMGDSG